MCFYLHTQELGGWWYSIGVTVSWTWCFGVIVPWCCAMVLSHGAMLPCKCISLNNTSSDQSGSPTTTAGITQCHAAAHTCSLSSPTLSSNRDKQHEICCDSALHGPGLLQDRTQGWLAPSLVDEPPHVSNEEDNIQKIHKIPVNRCNIKNRWQQWGRHWRCSDVERWCSTKQCRNRYWGYWWVRWGSHCTVKRSRCGEVEGQVRARAAQHSD